MSPQIPQALLILLIFIFGNISATLLEEPAFEELMLTEDTFQARQIFTNGSFTASQLALALLTIGALTAPFFLLNALGQGGQEDVSYGSNYGYGTRVGEQRLESFRSPDQTSQESKDRRSWLTQVPQIIEAAHRLYNTDQGESR